MAFKIKANILGMNKKIYILAALISLLLTIFTSCGDSKDDGIDYEWKARNEKLFEEAASTYTNILNSESQDGFIRFNKVSEGNSNLKMAQDGTIQFSDSVTVRYEGWYIKANGEKYIFDSTEKNNQVSITSPVKGGIFVDGHTTMLQEMKEGDEVEMCIPYKLGYGSFAQTIGNQTIPAYTTLFYNMKVVKVIPCNPKEFN